MQKALCFMGRFPCLAKHFEHSRTVTIAPYCDKYSLIPTPVPGAFRKRWILERPKNMPPACFLNGLSNPITPIKKLEPAKADSSFLVGVPGFEPGASWTRTKRDTKLRHTPIAKLL